MHRFSRPIVWGFFICSVAIVLLLGWRSLAIQSLESAWSQHQVQVEHERDAALQSAFHTRLNELVQVARRLVSDTTLIDRLVGNVPDDLVHGIDRLETYRKREDVSIDLVDPRGTILAWVGRSVKRDFKKEFEVEQLDTFALIIEADLHITLTVGLRVPLKELMVVVSRPLEVNVPISNRFVSKTSFARDVSVQLGTDVQLRSGVKNGEGKGDRLQVVAFKDFQGKKILEAVLPSPTVAVETQLLESNFDSVLRFLEAAAILFVAIGLWRWFAQMSVPLARVAGASVILWTVRYGWRFLEFPSATLGGPLFDPSLYASPFGYGITSSVGDTLITCIVLALNALLLARYALEFASTNRNGVKSGGPFGRLFWGLGAVTAAIGIPLIIRGYGAAVRSFVFDSTLHYHDPTVVFPEVPLLVVHVNNLLLTVSLLCFLLAFVGYLRVASARTLQRPLSWAMLAGILAISIVVFDVIEASPQVSYGHQVFILLIVFGLYLWIDQRRGLNENAPFAFGLPYGVIVLLAFVVSAPVLDSKLHDKERQQVQTVAEELLRPVDTWFTLVVTDALRSIQATFGRLASDGTVKFARDENAAFAQWARTILGKEGYNSVIVLYNSEGQEFSRFSVGLSSYEQGELLSRLFDVEEEALQLVERRVAGGTIKYYGIWGTVRNEHGDILGYVGLMLSTSQRSLFRGEIPAPLRMISRDRGESPVQNQYVSEYEDGYLVSSTDERLYRGLPLPKPVLTALLGSPDRFLWLPQRIRDKDFEVLYAKDATNPQRIIAVSVESLDLRWHLFNFTKMFIVYALVLSCGYFIAFGIDAYRRRQVLFRFREKLLTAFFLLTVLPLVLTGWYNKRLSVERLEQNITRELTKDLDLLQQRISSTVTDEYDFEAGVTDDYCEVLASDYGVDFSVFRQNVLQASSRPELYKAAILDRRISGPAFMHLVVLGQHFFQETETVGEVEYVVGYRPILLRGNVLGILSIPALYRQQEIDEELAQRNAFILGVYAIVLGLVLLFGIALANRLSKPLRDLSRAARRIGQGELDIRVQTKSSDEVGDLILSFNVMTEELKQNRERLAQAERELAWKEMAKQVAHEIKNPLTPIKLSIQHLRKAYEDRAKDFAAILQKVSGTIMEQIDSLSRIASEFSNFARMPERRFSRVDVHEVIRETLTLFGDVGGIEFRSNFWHTAPVLIADRDELRRVFINIIRNSVQAMETGGVIRIETKQNDHLCIIRITDSGLGIPEEIRKKVFQPNFSTKTDGMGLGLAIAQKIIQDLNGTIEIFSAPGEGTTVHISIPTAAISEGRPSDHST